MIALDLKQGEEAVIASRGFTGDLTIRPVDLAPADRNYYGVKDQPGAFREYYE